MHDAKVEARIRRKFRLVAVELDERRRRQWAAVEAQEVGWGGISLVARATGLSRPTIMAGLKDLQLSSKSRTVAATRVRCPGGGRRTSTRTDPGLLEALEQLIEPTTRGDPMSPLRWTCKSTANLAEELTRQNHPVSDRTVALLLKQSGYSLQANRKTREGSSHPDRNAQFEYINRQVRAFHRRRQPVISVDTKKKELVGEFKNPGEEWHPMGQPEKVNVHDFPDPKLGKAIPYGVYDLACNEGWVSVGIDHDTAEFACASIQRWWNEMGSVRFPQATELLITADGGGSNSSRNRLWKKSLQSLADELDITLHVHHFPPGTSKWNKIEHRLFCFITKNWRGRPLTTYEVIVNLIASTTTKTGLTVRAALDPRRYETGIAISAAEIAHLRIVPARFHGDWNYSITPRHKKL
jgi:Rhodopirellula transposase DDE domain